MMELSVAMNQRIGSNAECEQDHAKFKGHIINDIHAHHRQTREQQG